MEKSGADRKGPQKEGGQLAWTNLGQTRALLGGTRALSPVGAGPEGR